MAWFMVFVVGWSLLATSIADPGSVKLEGCSETLIDFPENANTTIVCAGFNPNANISWSIERNGQETRVATCNANANCAVADPDHFAVKRSPSRSQLNYSQYDSSSNMKIKCTSQFSNGQNSKECKVNFIRLATLPKCVVGIAAENSTVGGVCRFEGAFSSSRSFACTWYLEGSETISGNISYNGTTKGPNGWCTFLKKYMEMDLANSTYSILFYPGPGKMKVSSQNVDLNMLSGDLRKLLLSDTSSAAAALACGCLGAVVLGVIVSVNAVIT